MVHVITGSFEDLQRAMREGIEYGNRNLHSAQREVTYGSTWARFDTIPEGFVVYGKVLTLEDVRHRCIKAGGTELEARHEVRDTEDSEREDNMLYSVAYSTVVPEGELGSTHRLDLWPIDSEVFEALREAGWDHNRIDTGLGIRLSLAFVAWRTHAREVAQREQQRRGGLRLIQGGKR